MGEENKEQNVDIQEENENTQENQQEAENSNIAEEKKGNEGKLEENKKGEENNQEEDIEPPTRKKTKVDYILERQKRREEKMQKNQENNEESEEEDEISPEDEKIVDRIIQRRYGDAFAKIDKVEDEKEMSKFLSDNPIFKNYEKKIWKFWQHPSRNHLPIEDVAYAVAGKDLLKIGAKKEAEASEKARQTSTTGSSAKSEKGKIDYNSMTPAEFANYVEEVKRRKRD